MRAIGVDIGSFSIKIAEVEAQKSPVVRSFYEIELNHEPGQDVRLEKIEALGRVAKQYDARKYRFVLGIGSELATQRILTFPFTDRKKILQSLPFELEDVIPFSQSDAIFDFRIIHQKETSSQVLALAVPKKYIQELLILCDDAGFDPDIICPDGIAVGNHFENFQSAPSSNFNTSAEAELVLHVGYSKTLIDVLQNKTLIATRAVYFGGKDLSAAISRNYQLPYLEALKGVAEKGFILTGEETSDKDQQSFSKIIEQGLSVLVAELKRTMVDLKSELGIQFSQGHLLGGMGRLINLGPYLSKELGFPFNVFQHGGRTARSEVSITDTYEKAGAIAIGLGIEGLRKPRNPAINLRKNEFSKQSQRAKLLWEQYKNIAKMAAALFAVFCFYSYMRASFTESNVAAIDAAIKAQAKSPSLSIPNSQLKDESLNKFIKTKQNEIKAKHEVIRFNKMQSALDVVRTLSISAPRKGSITLDVRHINLDGERLLLEGFVGSKAELDLLQKSLAGQPGVSLLKAGQTGLQAPEKTPFLFTMSVARLSKEEKKKE